MAKEYHTYRCTNPVAGCSKFTVGEKYQLLVDEPPSPTHTVTEGVCAGTSLELDEPTDQED